MSNKVQVDAGPLATRHVFLDTEVYRRLKHNPANKALQVLREHTVHHVLSLHTTDITLLEIERQIAEDVAQTRLALNRADKDIRRWRHIVPEIPATPELSEVVPKRLFEALKSLILEECRGKTHDALSMRAAVVFEDYFARRAPFDAGSKEFPDSFALKALENWCRSNRETIYVVTKDAAMLRYVATSEHLLPLQTIEALLAAAQFSAEPTQYTEAIAEDLLNAPAFDHHLETALVFHEDELIIEYQGDLPEGEVNAVRFEGVIQSVLYNIVSLSTDRISLVLTVDAEIAADLGFEDRGMAMYDKEDDQWIGTDWAFTTVKGSIPLELYIELSLETGEIITSQLLRAEYAIT